jgi:DNA repair and recombination protein RAD52
VMFTPEMKEELAKPLGKAHVKTRDQDGRSMAYVEGWHVIAEANRIFGFDGWHRETVGLTCVREPEEVANAKGYKTWRVGYIAKVRVQVGAVVREGTGFGSGAAKDKGEAIESAVKEAETDAMKRALMTFGNPFGLALYDKTQANVCDTPAEPERPAYDEGYLNAALKEIREFNGTVTALKTWWEGEEAYRREAGIENKGEGVEAYAKLFEAFKKRGFELIEEANRKQGKAA